MTAERRRAEALEARRELRAQTQSDGDQSASDLDQTQSDADWSGSEADEAASADDQRLADREQHAADRDQAAADSDGIQDSVRIASGAARETSRREREATAHAREGTAGERSRTTAQRRIAADHRDAVASVRDRIAGARDRTAQARDSAADARDVVGELRERQALELDDAGVIDSVLAQLRELRLSGAHARQEAAHTRVAGAADRDASASDREHAEVDRRDAGMDELTGVFERGTGELALNYEIARSRKAGGSLVLALIDVGGLKLVNDADGNAAGDALLRAVVQAISDTVAPADITVRWNGGLFACAMSGVTLGAASNRTTAISAALDAFRTGASISVGLAELGDEDGLEALVGRADVALNRAKASRERHPE